MAVRIRLATQQDYLGFARVACEVHEHHVAAAPDVFRSVDTPVPQEDFAQLVAGEDSDVIIAEINEEIVGYAVLLLRRATREMLVPRAFGWLKNFGVSEEHRRQGVGRRLLDACAAWAKDRGATSLELDCWEANQGAIAFYTSMGMRVTRRWFAMEI